MHFNFSLNLLFTNFYYFLCVVFSLGLTSKKSHGFHYLNPSWKEEQCFVHIGYNKNWETKLSINLGTHYPLNSLTQIKFKSTRVLILSQIRYRNPNVVRFRITY